MTRELVSAQADAPWDSTDFIFRGYMTKLNSLQEEAKSWGVSLQLAEISEKLGRFLVKLLSKLLRTFDEGDAGRIFRLLTLCRAMAFRPEAWKLQTLFFQFVMKGAENPELMGQIDRIEKFVDELDGMLNCRFGQLLRRKSQLGELGMRN
jgi:hypothetical protein